MICLRANRKLALDEMRWLRLSFKAAARDWYTWGMRWRSQGVAKLTWPNSPARVSASGTEKHFPSGLEVVAKGGEEIPWSVDRKATGVNDMPQNTVDGTNYHFLEFVEGDGILATSEGGGS